jgi:DNA-binding NarL/FixJ family response regulator
MRIILADHHAQPRWALRTMIEEQPEFDLAGEVVDAQSLLALAGEHIADLLLIDRDLPGLDIKDLIGRLRTLDPRPIIAIMSSEFEHSRSMLRAGADAFVSKSDQPDWLLEMLHHYAIRISMKEDATGSKKL